jgi:DNA-binding IclR family transcriptional regulator
VKHPDGTIFGALGIGGPTYRIDDERLIPKIDLSNI